MANAFSRCQFFWFLLLFVFHMKKNVDVWSGDRESKSTNGPSTFEHQHQHRHRLPSTVHTATSTSAGCAVYNGAIFFLLHHFTRFFSGKIKPMFIVNIKYIWDAAQEQCGHGQSTVCCRSYSYPAYWCTRLVFGIANQNIFIESVYFMYERSPG